MISANRVRRLDAAVGALAVVAIAGAGAACTHSSAREPSSTRTTVTPTAKPPPPLPQSVAGFQFGRPWKVYRRACSSIAIAIHPESVLCPAALPRPIPSIGRIAPPRAYGYVCWMGEHRHCLLPRDAESAKPKDARLYYLVNAFYGAPNENPRHQRRNTPQRFFQLMVWGGPVPDGALQLRDKTRGRLLQRPLGAYSVDGHRGQLYRGLPYWLGGGEYGNHYTFVWGGPQDRMVVSVHAWVPRSETLAVLRAVVGWLRLT
jgi:hypothetical protein